ncbi:hypothetical protein [Chryseobacterium sp.]|uniref:hypothetical protein n=1 Tax=Chryseobacterium sp. TaxID=1871047 RepID=UPI00262C40F6|nr:hypothetical protein [Chryseobacterium sp.]
MEKTFIFYTILRSSDFILYAQSASSAAETDISRDIALIYCSVGKANKSFSNMAGFDEIRKKQ